MSASSRLAALLLLLGAPAARAERLDAAQLPPERGVYLGVRAAYAFPLGRFDNGPDKPYLSDLFSSAVPLQLDLGYRITPHLRVGLYAMYAPVQTSSFCEEGVCSGSSKRVGLSAEYHLLPYDKVDGWAGLGVGREWTRFSAGNVQADYSGLEWLLLQAGVDFRVQPRVVLGPHFGWTFAHYSKLEARVGSGTGSEAIRQRALHGWMMFGARAQVAF